MKINLRDLFWLIFVAALLTMWWMDRSKLADRLSFYETPKSAPQSTIARSQPMQAASSTPQNFTPPGPIVDLDYYFSRQQSPGANAIPNEEPTDKAATEAKPQAYFELLLPKGPTADLGYEFRQTDFARSKS